MVRPVCMHVLTSALPDAKQQILAGSHRCCRCVSRSVPNTNPVVLLGGTAGRPAAPPPPTPSAYASRPWLVDMPHTEAWCHAWRCGPPPRAPLAGAALACGGDWSSFPPPAVYKEAATDPTWPAYDAAQPHLVNHTIRHPPALSPSVRTHTSAPYTSSHGPLHHGSGRQPEGT